MKKTLKSAISLLLIGFLLANPLVYAREPAAANPFVDPVVPVTVPNFTPAPIPQQPDNHKQSTGLLQSELLNSAYKGISPAIKPLGIAFEGATGVNINLDNRLNLTITGPNSINQVDQSRSMFGLSVSVFNSEIDKSSQSGAFNFLYSGYGSTINNAHQVGIGNIAIASHGSTINGLWQTGGFNITQASHFSTIHNASQYGIGNLIRANNSSHYRNIKQYGLFNRIDNDFTRMKNIRQYGIGNSISGNLRSQFTDIRQYGAFNRIDNNIRSSFYNIKQDGSFNKLTNNIKSTFDNIRQYGIGNSISGNEFSAFKNIKQLGAFNKMDNNIRSTFYNIKQHGIGNSISKNRDSYLANLKQQGMFRKIEKLNLVKIDGPKKPIRNDSFKNKFGIFGDLNKGNKLIREFGSPLKPDDRGVLFAVEDEPPGKKAEKEMPKIITEGVQEEMPAEQLIEGISNIPPAPSVDDDEELLRRDKERMREHKKQEREYREKVVDELMEKIGSKDKEEDEEKRKVLYQVLFGNEDLDEVENVKKYLIGFLENEATKEDALKWLSFQSSSSKLSEFLQGDKEFRDQVVNVVLSALDSGIVNTDTKLNILFLLKHSGSPRAVDAVIAIIKQSTPGRDEKFDRIHIFDLCMEILQQSSEPRAFAAIVEALNDSEHSVQAAAAIAIEKSPVQHKSGAVKPLVSILNDPLIDITVSSVKVIAESILSKIAKAEDVPFLAKEAIRQEGKNRDINTAIGKILVREVENPNPENTKEAVDSAFDLVKNGIAVSESMAFIKILSQKEHIPQLVQEMKQLASFPFSDNFAKALQELNWQPQNIEEKIIYYGYLGEWKKVAELGSLAAEIIENGNPLALVNLSQALQRERLERLVIVRHQEILILLALSHAGKLDSLAPEIIQSIITTHFNNRSSEIVNSSFGADRLILTKGSQEFKVFYLAKVEAQPGKTELNYKEYFTDLFTNTSFSREEAEKLAFLLESPEFKESGKAFLEVLSSLPEGYEYIKPKNLARKAAAGVPGGGLGGIIMTIKVEGPDPVKVAMDNFKTIVSALHSELSGESTFKVLEAATQLAKDGIDSEYFNAATTAVDAILTSAEGLGKELAFLGGLDKKGRLLNFEKESTLTDFIELAGKLNRTVEVNGINDICFEVYANKNLPAGLRETALKEVTSLVKDYSSGKIGSEYEPQIKKTMTALSKIQPRLQADVRDCYRGAEDSLGEVALIKALDTFLNSPDNPEPAKIAEDQARMLQHAAGESILDRGLYERYSEPILRSKPDNRIIKRLEYVRDELKSQNNW